MTDNKCSPETEGLALIDKRLADLREANDVFRGMDWDWSRDIQRNDREIRWLADLRSVLVLRGVAQAPSDPQFAADAVSDEDLIAEAPPTFRQLAFKLTELLDEDHWNNIEPYLLDVARLLRGTALSSVSSTDREGK